MNSKKQTVLLIGGAMRSGTTVIHRSLCTAENSNPYISECWYLYEIMHMYRWNLSRYDIRHADQFGTVANLQELIWLNVRQYLQLVSQKYNNPDVLVLKHPELTYYFSELAANFNQFKFVVIVRDPRDVIASMVKVGVRHEDSKIISPQSQVKTIEQHCDNYFAYYRDVFQNFPYMKDRLLFVKYENFMQNPAAELARISALTGAVYQVEKAIQFLPEHAQAANFDIEKRKADAFSGAFWSDAYTQPLTSERIGSYTNVLDEKQVAVIEQRLALFGKEFSYWSTTTKQNNIGNETTLTSN